MRIGSLWSRLVAALVVLATIPIGAKASAGVHLAVVVAILAAMLALDSRTGAGAQAGAHQALQHRP